MMEFTNLQSFFTFANRYNYICANKTYKKINYQMTFLATITVIYFLLH